MGLFGFGGNDAYVILGHGDDSAEYNTRAVVPNGFTFVTNPVCGQSIMNANYISKLTKIQTLNKNVYSHPEKHKSSINRAVQETHIFTPSMKYPSMNIQFGEHFQNKNQYIKIRPVGLFKMPTSIQYNNGKTYHTSQINKDNVYGILDELFFHNDNLLKDHFKKLLGPKIQGEVEKFKASGNVVDLFLNLHVTYSIQELVEKGLLPKGVHYLFMCRGYAHGNINDKVKKTRRASINQQRAKFGTNISNYSGLASYATTIVPPRKISTVSEASSVSAGEESANEGPSTVISKRPNFSMYGRNPLLSRKKFGGRKKKYTRKERKA